MNYVFAWMTLRWKSIIPGAIAHGVWNILAVMQMGSSRKARDKNHDVHRRLQNPPEPLITSIGSFGETELLPESKAKSQRW